MIFFLNTVQPYVFSNYSLNDKMFLIIMYLVHVYKDPII